MQKEKGNDKKYDNIVILIWTSISSMGQRSWFTLNYLSSG